MSIESARAFLEKLRSDEVFAKRVSEAATAEARIRLVGDAGYMFTEAEFNIVTSELSDEELDMVSGGADDPGGNAFYLSGIRLIAADLGNSAMNGYSGASA